MLWLFVYFYYVNAYYVYIAIMVNFMKSSIKTPLISVAFATMPLNSNAEFCNHKNDCVNCINTSLFENLNNDSIVSNDSNEKINLVKVNSKIVVDAVLNYFDEDVKMFKLSQEAKIKLTELLNSYLSNHWILKLWSDWNLVFVIDNKKEFSLMVKKFVNIVLNDMPFLVRKVVIPLFLGGNDVIQQKLDNLDETLMNMKEKQYKDIMLDYIAWFIKRVAISSKSNMKVGTYFDTVSGYYPNNNSSKIKNDLDVMWLKNMDIKNLKYPLKK